MLDFGVKRYEQLPRIKKWFMLQVWRLQQVAQILTLGMMALTLSLTIFNLIKWRTGSLLSTSWIGVPMILLVLMMIIWTFAIFWDLRLKMWRDQATVLIERNPYAKEKMASKEIALYGLIWLPVLEKMGETDPKIKAAAEALKQWMRKATKEDHISMRDVKELGDHIGIDISPLFESEEG